MFSVRGEKKKSEIDETQINFEGDARIIFLKLSHSSEEILRVCSRGRQ